MALGDFDKAEALSARWMAEFGERPLDNHVLYGRVMAIYLAARHPERRAQAGRWLAELEAEFAARERGEGLGMVKTYMLHVAWAKAALLREQGRHEDAIAALRAAEPYDALCEVTFVHMSVRDELQRSYAALGRWREAHEAMLEFAQRQAHLLSGANAVRLQALAIQHAVERERLARQKAEESERIKSEFLANVSHEIRTPMNAIIGMAHLALRTPLSPTARDYVDKIHRAGQTLLGLINDILDFSKIEAGKLDVRPEDFDLDELIGNVVIVTGHDAAQKGLAWSVEIAADVPRRVRGDPLRLGQVLINLVNNAIKFTDAGRRRHARHLAPRRGRRARAPVLRGARHGHRPERRAARPAVPALRAGRRLDEPALRRHRPRPQHLAPARRADGRRDPRAERARRGLVLRPARAARAAAGARRAGSGRGAGAARAGRAGRQPAPRCVAARWPRARTAAVPAGEPAPAPADVPPSLLRHAGRRVLVVEDNAVNRQIAGELLRNAGLVVDMAEDGTRALARLRDAPADRYDLVLMDLQMPRLDGHDTAVAIRSDARHARLPVIALTAHTEAAVRERCIAEGMQDFVTKPISPDELYAVVARWLGPAALEVRAPVPAAPRARAAVARAARAAGAAPEAGRADASARAQRAMLAEGLPGFDTATAIAALGGSTTLYRQVLARFAQDQAGGADALRRLAVEGRHGDALRAVHTLKGLAATIGAPALRGWRSNTRRRCAASSAPRRSRRPTGRTSRRWRASLSRCSTRSPRLGA